MKITNPNHQHYNLNVRILQSATPSKDEAKEIRNIISKALLSQGYDALVWEQAKTVKK